MAIVTNGKVVFTRRVTTGNYEHRDAVVELSFTVAEGEDLSAAVAAVAEAARFRAEAMATGKEGPAPAAKPPGVAVAETKKPAPEKLVSAKVEKAAEKPAQTPLEKVGLTDDLDFLEAPQAATAEINDAKLVEHVTHANAGGKNTQAIRQLMVEFVGPPPGKVRDIPQDRRQEFINRLPKP